MSEVYLALGSNIGNREESLIKAVGELKQFGVIKKLSSLYETKAFGEENQDNFYNIVLCINTDLKPDELLEVCKSLEKKLGRMERYRWGPREIDIDILLYNDFSMDSDLLTIPHKGLYERDFFLEPLMEISPEIKLENKLPISKALSNLKVRTIIRKMNFEY